MTIAISESDYTQLWQQDRQQIGSQGDRQSDTIDFCPPEFGRGFERWIKLPGIELLIIDRQFDQNLTIEYSASEPESYAEFGFNILGNWHHQSSGTNFLDLIVDRSYAGGIYQVNQGERILKVDIHLQPSQLLSNFITDGFDLFPLELKQVIEGKDAEFYGNVCINTAAMKLALNQIVNCPFSGAIRQLYLESKCLELIALKLEQITKNELNSVREIVLKSEDIDRIHQAKDILIDRLHNPPSLTELARQVGLNDRKLKQGFHQVFDTTVFGYLHEYRMVTAMNSISTGNMNINQAIRTVGYASRSSFCKAFKKRFGASPRNYLS